MKRILIAILISIFFGTVLQADMMTFPPQTPHPVKSDNSGGWELSGDINIDGTIDITDTATNRFLMPTNNDPTSPTFGIDTDGDSGIYTESDDSIAWALGGVKVWAINSTGFVANSASGPGMLDESASTINPTLVPVRSDTDTGIGRNAIDHLSVIAGGVEAIAFDEGDSHVLFDIETDIDITASTTQSQGQQPLLSSANEITVVGNANDVVTLPSALLGRFCIVINNGANTLQIFPASGDDLGAGVDASETLAAGSNYMYFAVDAVNWEKL